MPIVSADVLEAETLGTVAEAMEFVWNVVESSTEYSVIATDLEGTILLWNEGARRLYGYEPEEMVGRPWSILGTPADARAGLPDDMTDEALRHDKWTGALQRVRKDGSQFTARVVATPRRDAHGKETGFLLISSDVTEEARLANDLARAQAYTRSLIESARDANLELEEASRAKDRFLASMSHELRTPLNAILGFTGTMLMKLPGPLTDDQEKQLRTVQANGRHLLSLINDLLDLARIESGKVDVNLEPIDCHALLDDVASGLRPLADAKGIELEVKAPGDVLEVQTDRRALSQILINLANNAIKFTDRGGVRLELTRDVRGAEQVTRFSVADTGHGIKPGEQKRLFAAFEQLDASSGNPYEGTGLGLYICLRLARLIDGGIAFESEFGRGSTFTLELRT
jgi:protein-histidine pros-kinase